MIVPCGRVVLTVAEQPFPDVERCAGFSEAGCGGVAPGVHGVALAGDAGGREDFREVQDALEAAVLSPVPGMDRKAILTLASVVTDCGEGVNGVLDERDCDGDAVAGCLFGSDADNGAAAVPEIDLRPFELGDVVVSQSGVPEDHANRVPVFSDPFGCREYGALLVGRKGLQAFASEVFGIEVFPRIVNVVGNLLQNVPDCAEVAEDIDPCLGRPAERGELLSVF